MTRGEAFVTACGVTMSRVEEYGSIVMREAWWPKAARVVCPTWTAYANRRWYVYENANPDEVDAFADVDHAVACMRRRIKRTRYLKRRARKS